MTKIIITIPNNKFQKVVDAFKNEDNPPEGVLDEEYPKHMILEFIKDTVLRYEKDIKFKIARQSTSRDEDIAA